MSRVKLQHREREALAEGSRAIGRSGMVVGSAGNLSLRAGIAC